MRLRVDGNYRLGYPVSQSGQTGPIRYSHYLLVEHSPPPATPPVPLPVTPAPLTYPAPEVTYLSLSPACLAYITCLRRELDWRVLQPMIQGVAQIVQHKALILSKHNSDIDYLTSTLCAMVSDKTMCAPDLLRNTQGKLTRSDMQGYIFPVLATLASYHARIEFSLQQRLIKCLEYGLASRSVRQCVLALTSCVLEMRDTMVKLLPEVLLNLSHVKYIYLSRFSLTVSPSVCVGPHLLCPRDERRNGLASRSVRQCVLALTSCVLEMRDTMVKLLPEVLLNLSHVKYIYLSRFSLSPSVCVGPHLLCPRDERRNVLKTSCFQKYS
ncbi:Tuberous sclerosis 2-like protein [Homalodisca vitripennis]|nr:Tuberous sclerosis 2-like protein [Homalodisca vitripennis]